MILVVVNDSTFDLLDCLRLATSIRASHEKQASLVYYRIPSSQRLIEPLVKNHNSLMEEACHSLALRLL